MLGTFCLRLACGLIASLLVFPAGLVNPRFFRVHFLTALALTGTAGVSLRSDHAGGLGLALAAALLLTFLGSVIWSLEGGPGGTVAAALAVAALSLSLSLAGHFLSPKLAWGWLLADEWTSAAVLGTATTAMLIGHSYLIAPTMSLVPLHRLLIALFLAILVRMAVAAVGLWCWTAGHSLVNLEDETVLWLPLRWGLGFVGPLILGWMARQTAKIRSTQSATGILYVVVIFCFLGELTSQLLRQESGFVL
jgi:hypothetical protein